MPRKKIGEGTHVALALRRLLRCHPWNPGGIDYVPESLEPPRAVFGRYVRTLRHNRKG